MISKLWEKLRDPVYRSAFVASQINIGIPFQIRALLKARGWTQEKLADRTGMLQPRISAMLKPGKTRPNIETLRRIAEAFDCGLMIRFVPFSALALWSEQFSPDIFDVLSFEAEEKTPIFTSVPHTAAWVPSQWRDVFLRQETPQLTTTEPVCVSTSTVRAAVPRNVLAFPNLSIGKTAPGQTTDSISYKQAETQPGVANG